MLEVVSPRPFTPKAVEEIFSGELGGVVRSAVRSVARGCVDREALVSDVCSELAVGLLSGAFSAHDPGRSSFRTYLAAAARNRARDLLRRSRSRSRHVSLDSGEPDQAPVPQAGRSCMPLEALLDEEERAVLRAGLRELRAWDPIGSRILEARYLEGLSYEAIVEELGFRSLDNLHVRAHRARRALGRWLRNRASWRAGR